MQLVAYGAQDIYLTGNPQITFFKVVYRRHTNFSMEAIEQTWNGSQGLGSNRSTATISRNGDLVSGLVIETAVNVEWATAIEAASNANDTIQNYGHNLFANIELEIGGQKIDKHTGEWLQVWHDLTDDSQLLKVYPPSEVVAKQTTNLLSNRDYVRGVGIHKAGATAGIELISPLTVAHGDVRMTGRIFTPLQFWFCRNPGLALPLIALQYHEVKVIVEWAAKTAGGGPCYYDHSATDVPVLIDTDSSTYTLWADYIYLDTDERRRFAQVSHEYLIEQVQLETLSVPHTTGTVSATKNLNFNHPVKELIWVTRSSSTDGSSGTRMHLTDFFAPKNSTVSSNDTGTVQLKLNGHDRFAARSTHYFTREQVSKYHSGNAGIAVEDVANADPMLFPNVISVYSFALKPEEHQPSGSCNFSRIDNAQMEWSSALLDSGAIGADAANFEILVFAVNYNVLRIMSGMGGLAYSN